MKSIIESLRTAFPNLEWEQRETQVSARDGEELSIACGSSTVDDIPYYAYAYINIGRMSKFLQVFGVTPELAVSTLYDDIRQFIDDTMCGCDSLLYNNPRLQK